MAVSPSLIRLTNISLYLCVMVSVFVYMFVFHLNFLSIHPSMDIHKKNSVSGDVNW